MNITDLTIYYLFGGTIYTESTCTMQALVNVPALSERTIRRDIARSDVSTGRPLRGPKIQVRYMHADGL